MATVRAEVAGYDPNADPYLAKRLRVVGGLRVTVDATLTEGDLKAMVWKLATEHGVSSEAGRVVHMVRDIPERWAEFSRCRTGRAGRKRQGPPDERTRHHDPNSQPQAETLDA